MYPMIPPFQKMKFSQWYGPGNLCSTTVILNFLALHGAITSKNYSAIPPVVAMKDFYRINHYENEPQQLLKTKFADIFH